MAAQGKNDAQARSKLHHWRILRQRRSFGATTHAPPADPLVGYGVAAAVQIIVGTPLHTLKTFQSVMASVQRTWIVLLLPYGRFHILKKINSKGKILFIFQNQNCTSTLSKFALFSLFQKCPFRRISPTCSNFLSVFSNVVHFVRFVVRFSLIFKQILSNFSLAILSNFHIFRLFTFVSRHQLKFHLSILF